MTAPAPPSPPPPGSGPPPGPAPGPGGPARRRPPGTGSVVAAICRDDLLHIARDRTALLFMVVMPVVVMVIIGATFGEASGAATVGLVDADGSPAAAAVRHALDESDALEVRVFAGEEDLRRDVRAKVISGGVVIPAGFGAALDGDGRAALSLVVEPSDTGGQSLATVVRAVVAREGGVRAAARFAAGQTGEDPAAAEARSRELAERLAGVPVEVVTVGERSLGADNRYTYPALSNLVLFVFVSTLAGGTAIIERRRLGVTRRMLAAPVTARSVIVGTAAARLLVAVLQSAVIVTIGALVFGVRWGDPVGVALLVVTFAAMATAVALVVGSVAGNAEQAQAVGIPVAIALGMLGGTMWPLEIVPRPLQVIGHLTPHAWAMDAWMGLAFRDAGVGDIAVDLLVLTGMTVAAGVVASLALRRSLLAS